MAIIQATITKPITMKLRCLIFLFFVNFVSCKLLADDGKLEQSNINLPLHDFLSGVKYAFIDLDDKEQADIEYRQSEVTDTEPLSTGVLGEESSAGRPGLALGVRHDPAAEARRRARRAAAGQGGVRRRA